MAKPQTPSLFSVSLASYRETLLWSETAPDGSPLDSLGLPLSPDAKEQTARDVREFWASLEAQGITWSDLEESFQGRGDAAAQLGHDFCLTRNRHGAGFWDGDWAEPVAGRLTYLAHKFGEIGLEVDDEAGEIIVIP